MDELFPKPDPRAPSAVPPGPLNHSIAQSLNHSIGRFTVRGSEELESRMRALIDDVAKTAKGMLSPSDCRALVLLGGYGRGEGGVEIVNGQECPHNNLDFLIITDDLSPGKQARLKAEFQKALNPLSERYGVQMDLGATTVSQIGNAPSLVIWYDMRFGHKTVFGDASFVPSLEHLRVDRIPDWDIRNLMVNRGTLILINDVLLDRKALDADIRKLIVKHTMKAIIGYGDALLFFRGAYHWSYLEKQRRMRACTDLSSDLRALYDEAIEFRFQPNYAAYADRDLRAWMAELRERFEPLHRTCEAKRLRVDALTWEQYPGLALRRALFEDVTSARSWAKKAINLLRGSACPAGVCWTARLGYRMIGIRGIYPILFPAAAYAIAAPAFVAFAAKALNAKTTEPAELRRAYLRLFSRDVDVNCGANLRKWNLSVEP